MTIHRYGSNTYLVDYGQEIKKVPPITPFDILYCREQSAAYSVKTGTMEWEVNSMVATSVFESLKELVVKEALEDICE